jgi:hypothetical protein
MLQRPPLPPEEYWYPITVHDPEDLDLKQKDVKNNIHVSLNAFRNKLPLHKNTRTVFKTKINSGPKCVPSPLMQVRSSH